MEKKKNYVFHDFYIIYINVTGYVIIKILSKYNSKWMKVKKKPLTDFLAQ